MLKEEKILRSPDDEEAKPASPKVEETDAFKNLKSDIESLAKQLSEIKSENKKLSSELSSTRQELQDTRDAYKEVFGEKGNEISNETNDAPHSVDLLEEVAKCELK